MYFDYLRILDVSQVLTCIDPRSLRVLQMVPIHHNSTRPITPPPLWGAKCGRNSNLNLKENERFLLNTQVCNLKWKPRGIGFDRLYWCFCVIILCGGGMRREGQTVIVTSSWEHAVMTPSVKMYIKCRLFHSGKKFWKRKKQQLWHCDEIVIKNTFCLKTY